MPSKPSGILELDRLEKRFGTSIAVTDISLVVARGEVVCLLGPSGCGKTTTLRMIAGFVAPSAGRILIDGADVSRTPPHRRDTGLVFQNYALFPHMTVAQNIAFAPENVGMKAPDVSRRVQELLEIVQMSAYSGRLPNELSGGQQQRVALARALAVRPAVLLLDEPFSNLDARLRMQMREEVRAVIDRLGTTTVFVTHDQEEALAVADRIVIMNEGAVEQIGTPADIYERPGSRFVAQFIGRCNLIGVHVTADGRTAVLPGGHKVEVQEARPGATTLAVRPQHVRLSAPGEVSMLTGRVVRAVYQGSTTHLTIALDGFSIMAEAASEVARGLVAGEAISIGFEPRHARLLP